MKRKVKRMFLWWSCHCIPHHVGLLGLRFGWCTFYMFHSLVMIHFFPLPRLCWFLKHLQQKLDTFACTDTQCSWDALQICLCKDGRLSHLVSLCHTWWNQKHTESSCPVHVLFVLSHLACSLELCSSDGQIVWHCGPTGMSGLCPTTAMDYKWHTERKYSLWPAFWQKKVL